MRVFVLAVLFVASPVAAQGTGQSAAAWAGEVGGQYVVRTGISYHAAGGYDARLDLYTPRAATATNRVPTVVYIHGGGWAGGDRNGSVLQLLPYLEMGWAVVNIDYRGWATPGINSGRAPAAVQDARCALGWVARSADRFNLDTASIVVTGESAGGHLALITAMLDSSAGMDATCPGPPVRVAAVVNWYGPTDVAGLLSGPDERDFAVAWFDSVPDRERLARALSPISRIGRRSPPVFSVHGTADEVVPFAHATRFHRALTDAGVPNELFIVREGHHGGFSGATYADAYTAIRTFLSMQGLIRQPR